MNLYVNSPERIALRQEQIDAVNAMKAGVSLEEIANTYPNWGPRLLKDYGTVAGLRDTLRNADPKNVYLI